MRTHQDVEADEEVRVFDVNGHRVGQPKGGWAGAVVKAGPKLVTISYAGKVQVFRRDEGHANDQYGHQFYKTLEEAELDRREREVRQALRDLGIDVARHCELTVDRLEAMAQAATAGTGKS
jgi:hypothetical protein